MICSENSEIPPQTTGQGDLETKDNKEKDEVIQQLSTTERQKPQERQERKEPLCAEE